MIIPFSTQINFAVVVSLSGTILLMTGDCSLVLWSATLSSPCRHKAPRCPSPQEHQLLTSCKLAFTSISPLRMIGIQLGCSQAKHHQFRGQMWHHHHHRQSLADLGFNALPKQEIQQPTADRGEEAKRWATFCDHFNGQHRRNICSSQDCKMTIVKCLLSGPANSRLVAMWMSAVCWI